MLNSKMLLSLIEKICFIMTVIVFGCGVAIPMCQMFGNYVVAYMLMNVFAVAMVLSLATFITRISFEL